MICLSSETLVGAAEDVGVNVAEVVIMICLCFKYSSALVPVGAGVMLSSLFKTMSGGKDGLSWDDGGRELLLAAAAAAAAASEAAWCC